MCYSEKQPNYFSPTETNWVCLTSVSILGLILDYFGIWGFFCLVLASKAECPLPHSLPQVFWVSDSEKLSRDSVFTFPCPALSLAISYPAWFFFTALNTIFFKRVLCIEQGLALSGTQENIYWIGKLIKNRESHKFCVSAHLILGMTKWLTLANELCKWKWQYISLG